MTIVNVKRLIDTLVEKCSEDINGNEIVYNATLNDYGGVCKSCTIYIVLLIITLEISMGIGSSSFYFDWYMIKIVSLDCFINV